MPKVLHVKTSAVGTASNSSKLGEKLIAKIPNAVVTVRDMGKNPPAIINQVIAPAIANQVIARTADP
jgi:FMN-dependent NADH-azoreductase